MEQERRTAGKHRRAAIASLSIPHTERAGTRRLLFLRRPISSSRIFRLVLKSLVLQSDSLRPILQRKKQSKKFLLCFFLLLAEPLSQLWIGAFRKNKIDDVFLGHDFLNQLIIQRMQQINEIRGTNVANTFKKPFHFQSAHLFSRRHFRLINDNLAPAFRRRVPHIHIGHQIPRSSILFRSF